MNKHIFIEACYSKPTSETPVWFMRQAGRYMKEYQKIREKYNILDIARTPELAAEVTLQPVKAFSFDAAILFADIVLPLAPIGIDVIIKDGIGPIIKNPVASERDIAKLLKLDWQKDFGYLEKTIKILLTELDGRVPLIGFSGAPFTLAGYIIEGAPSRTFTKTKMMMYRQPLLWHKLMSLLTDTVISYLKGQVSAGIEAVQLFDSWAGALSPADYKIYVLPYSKRIFSSLKAAKIPRIHFGTDTYSFLEEFSSVDCEVVGVDWRTPVASARKIIGKKAFQGNLDPHIMFADFSYIKKRIDEIFRDVGDRRGFIFNLGHGILPETPRENVKKLVEYIHQK